MVEYYHKPLLGALKYGFYEQEIFHKERKEFQRTLRRLFKKHFKLNIKDSKIKISSNYCKDGVINRKNPTVRLVYKQYALEFNKEELDMIYNEMFSNKFSGRFPPIEFFEYFRGRKKAPEEKDLEKRRKRKRIVDGKCEYCGNTDNDRMESLMFYGTIYFKCTACK